MRRFPGPSRGAPLLRVVIAVLALSLAGCGRSPAPADQQNQASKKPPSLVVPAQGAYTGAYIDFGDLEDGVTLEGIEDFEQLVGKHQAIIAFSSFWGENHFPAEATRIIAQHGSVPLVFWSPWDWPYREEDVYVHGPDKYNLENILTGRWDDYIDRWADGAKALGTPMFVSLCNEMNGDWFPWSAGLYGGGQPIAGTDPLRYVGPEYFKRAYRYIVDRVRERGAANVLWVLHLNNFSEPYAPWNALAEYYPGSSYVDWLGLSVYGQLESDDAKWDLFDDMIQKPYDEICRLDPDKPVMITEWGVGEFPARGDKAAWIATGFEHMATRFPRLHAALYWHERWQNTKTMLYSNLRVNSSPGALAAYRKGVSAPFWLAEPIYR